MLSLCRNQEVSEWGAAFRAGPAAPCSELLLLPLRALTVNRGAPLLWGAGATQKWGFPGFLT